MSLESALQEEAQAVLALLEGRAPSPTGLRNRTKSPSPALTNRAHTPVRSMLDVDGPLPSAKGRHASIAGQGVGITSAKNGQRSSMLDVNSLSPSSGQVRSASKSTIPQINIEKDYNFNVQGGRSYSPMSSSSPLRPTASNSSYGEFTHERKPSTSDSQASVLAKQQKQQQQQQKGRSSSWLSPRNKSPAASKMLNTNSMNLMSNPNTYVTSTGQRLDLSEAYRRFSDASLAYSGSTLAELPVRRGVDTLRGESLAPDGSIRITTDDTGDIDSSDRDSSGSDDDGESSRGRGREAKDVVGSTQDSQAPKSLLAAADDEMKQQAMAKKIMANTKIQSMLDTGIVDVDGKLSHGKKGGVHPNTAFNTGVHHDLDSANDTDEEEYQDDITKALSLSLRVSKISSDASQYRSMRTILRGDYSKIDQDAKSGFRRQRLYMVATDLSEEAAYALEWTVGTVLRDGDTLFAVYAMDINESDDAHQERERGRHGGSFTQSSTSATISPPESQNAASQGDGQKLMESTYNLVRTLSDDVEKMVPAQFGNIDSTTNPSHSRNGSNGVRFGNAFGGGVGITHSPDSRGKNRTESERFKAAEAISDRCIALLRKTKLQVRVIIDVVHCKSPKHIITEVIDYLTPTLVILGSRGRSQVKNVLLGSFSNYLVTKSSVPVMVARKKLKKSKSIARNGVSMSNVLQSRNNRLANAKIDK